VWVVVWHAGRVPAQSALLTHSTHVLVAGSHAAWPAPQAPVLPGPHATHRPEAAHTGWPDGHSPSTPQARQLCVAPSQTGVLPPQSAAATQATQVPATASQTGVAPVHAVAFVAEHVPHAPPGWQAGVAPPHSLSPTQPRHTCVVPSQTGAAEPHWMAARQATHVPVGAEQSGVGPAQAEAFVTEQPPQAPLGWQAGVAPPQSASPAQGRQVWVTGLHTGLVAPHCASLVQS
jgi:hypothetical protein